MRGHVDSETLAACREGLVSRRKARQVVAHLARCARCAGLDAQLADLPALLARSPAPPMPAALTARIEAALAAEAAARSATADTAAGVTRDTTGVTRDTTAARRHRKARAPSPGRSRLALRVAAAAAAVAVIAGGGYGLLRLLSGSGPYSAGTSVAAPAPAHGAAGSGARRAASRGSPRAATLLPSGSTGTLIVHSGTNYQPAQLKAQVRMTLARFAQGAQRTPAATPKALGPGDAAFANPPACAQRVARGRYVRLVDVARYEGRPAAVIVIAGPRPNVQTILVVTTRCSATANGPIFSTLLPTGG